jgi:hypothetical protein
MINNLLQFLLRRKTPINFLDFNRNVPISRVFGFDRGTPIDRYYIGKWLEKNAGVIKGRVLEVADSHYTKLHGKGRVDSYEVLSATHNGKATIVSDLTNINDLPENRLDCFICTQTFNFIFDVQKAIKGAHYLLKKGGVLIATVAGISQISRYDMERWGDYWRFTTASVEKLFEPLFKEYLQIESYGNVLATIALLQGMAVEDLPDPSLLDDHDQDYQMLIGIVAKKT